NAKNRQFRIHRLNSASHGAGHARGFHCRAGYQEDTVYGHLAMWKIVLNRRLTLETSLFDVTDNTNDLAPNRIALRIALEGYPSADRVFIRPELFLHCLVDDG